MLDLENLPQDVREALPREAQQLYIAAYNSFLDNSTMRNQLPALPGRSNEMSIIAEVKTASGIVRTAMVLNTGDL